MISRLIVDLLRATAGRPRVHGNGFIQVDLSQAVRLHVWGHDAIPRQASHTPVHDHTFRFTSYVLHGTLANVTYRFVEQRPAPVRIGTIAVQPHRATVRRGEDTVLTPFGSEGVLVHEETNLVSAGDCYSMAAGDIHESIPQGPSVSVIVKDGLTLAQGGPSPTVFVPLGVQPDNAFDRYAEPPEKLWEIIGLVLRDMLYAART